jgi:hypothetical protein
MIVDAGLFSSRPIDRSDRPSRRKSAIRSRSGNDNKREQTRSGTDPEPTAGGDVMVSIVVFPVV